MMSEFRQQKVLKDGAEKRGGGDALRLGRENRDQIERGEFPLPQLPKGRQAQRRFRAGALEQRVLQCLRQ